MFVCLRGRQQVLGIFKWGGGGSAPMLEVAFYPERISEGTRGSGAIPPASPGTEPLVGVRGRSPPKICAFLV